MRTFRVLMQDNDDNFQFAVYFETESAEAAGDAALVEFDYMHVTVLKVTEVIYEQ